MLGEGVETKKSLVFNQLNNVGQTFSYKETQPYKSDFTSNFIL